LDTHGDNVACSKEHADKDEKDDITIRSCAQVEEECEYGGEGEE
jgi:hypothetical protein